MARSKSSGRWLQEHFDDPYVKRAQREGYRSRSVYKLSEIDTRDKLLQSGTVVVDLGSAPGGWSQYAAQRVGDKGAVFALDILPMDSLAGVRFIQGDFHQQQPLDELLRILDGRAVDLVMCDMAPNLSGIKGVDLPRSMYLAELAVDFAKRVLKPGGDLLVKVFQGEGFDLMLADLRASFGRVNSRKPGASRARSSEVYLLARNYRL